MSKFSTFPGLPTPPSEKKPSNAAQFTTLFIQNETNPNLRYRNRSQESSASPQLTPISPENPKTFYSTYPSPGDSGIEPSPMPHLASPMAYPETKRKLEPEIRAELDSNFESPLDFFKSKFYRSKKLFNSDSQSFKVHQFLPVIIVTVILASAIFTMFALKAAVDRTYDSRGDIVPSNGKYASMDFAVKNYVKNLEESGKPLPYDVRDEDGQVLGGKKASIGYAHEVNNPKPKSVHIPIQPDQEVPNEPRTPTRAEKVARKLRLDKLNKNPKIAIPKSDIEPVEEQPKPVEEQPKPEEKPEQPVAKLEQRKIPRKSNKQQQSSNNVFNNAFKNENIGFRGNSDEDDPFRFQ